MRRLALASALVLACVLAVPSGRAEDAPELPLLRLALAGDVMFGRLLAHGYEAYDAPVPDALRTRLQAADLTFVNLETGLCEPREATAHAHETRAQRHRLAAPAARLDVLRALGVDLAVVANNHALDCGKHGLARTLRALAARHIAAVGAHHHGGHDLPVTRLHARGIDVLVVAASEHLAPVPGAALTPFTLAHADLTLVEQLAALRAAHPSSLLVLSLHWGTELAPHPAAQQRLFARRLIDGGVDVLYGHGPHVLQEVERYREGVIVYSAGNLHFDMAIPRALVELTFGAGKLRPVILSAESLSAAL